MKKEVKEWADEVARDTLALGSLVFLLLVLVRATLGPFWTFTFQVLIASIVLLVLSIFVKDYERHIAIGIILAVFMMLFYDLVKFNILATIAYVIMITSAIYLKKDKIAIIKGFLLGIISTLIGYYLAPIIVNSFNLPIR